MQPHTTAIDIWALALIYFKMLTGKPAFPGSNQGMVQQAIIKREIAWPKPGSGKKQLEVDERDIIDKMLTLDPAERLGGTPESMS